MTTQDAKADDPAEAVRAALYRYRFGSAEFDEARFELRVGGLLVEVQQKPLQLLAMLLASPGEVITKDAINATVWNDRATGDAVLANAVSKLRGALGADNAQAIATVPRQGYRFEGPLDRVAVGRQMASRMALVAGSPVPGRESYQLTQLLGSSHTNETWLARHPKTGDRRVFKFAVDGERLADLKREATLFRLLREALGERDDIARVLDWNFEHAPFWLECEYGGCSLEDWAQQIEGGGTRLSESSPDTRLNFLLQAADAVAAAHGAGVLHKDLKPANFLVDATASGGWQLRLTDFGSGRLLDPARLEALRITQLGMTLPSGGSSGSGTPYYMAPELGRGEPPSTRSDVYALGVMLYQLLAGDLKRLMAPGWERDISDPLLRDDIARATDVEPQHRLASAAELAARLRDLPARLLQREAGQRAAEREALTQIELTRARARRPWVVAAMAALAIGAASSLWLYLAERRATQALAREYAASQALNRLLREDLVAAANPAASGRADITVADALTAAATRVDGKFGALSPGVRAGLHGAMQSALSELSRSADAVSAGQRAVAAWQLAPDPDRDELQNVRLRLAVDLVQLSRLDDARLVVHDVEADAAPAAQQTPAFRARLLYVKSWLTGGDLSLKESVEQLQEAFTLVQPFTEAQAPGREKIMFALADNLGLFGRPAEGEALFRRLLAEQVSLYGEGHARPLVTLIGLGNTIEMQGRHDDAKQMLARAATGLATQLGAQHRMALSARDSLATVSFNAHDYAGAAAEWAVVRQGFAALMGEDSSYTITVQTNEGMALHYGGQAASGEALLRSALAHARKILKDDTPQVQQVRYALADCLLDRHRADEAASLLNGLDASALQLAQQEADWPARLDYQEGRVALARGDKAEAKRRLTLAHDGLASTGRVNPATVAALLRH